MARTLNRLPGSVPLPGKNDVKNYFFDHTNFKGICDDKNFLTVDQETFADGNNVYMDSDGLLRGRPSIKKADDLVFERTPEDVTLSTIKNFWSFNDIIVYQVVTDDIELYFVRDGIMLNYLSLNSEQIKLTLVKNKIWIFCEHSLQYFDTLTNECGDADEFIYIPNTKVIGATSETTLESKNVLTNEEIYTYLYNSEVGGSLDMYNKLLEIEILGQTYNFTFMTYTSDVLVNFRFNIPVACNFSDNSDIYFAVSEENTCAMFNRLTNTLLYSPDGKFFTSSTTLTLNYYEHVISKPKFSQNSAYVFICTNSTVYIVSVKADNNSLVKRFENFTDVQSYCILNSYHSESEEVSNDVDFDFITWDHFAGVYPSMYVPDGGTGFEIIYYNNAQNKRYNRQLYYYDDLFGDTYGSILAVNVRLSANYSGDGPSNYKYQSCICLRVSTHVNYYSVDPDPEAFYDVYLMFDPIKNTDSDFPYIARSEYERNNDGNQHVYDCKIVGDNILIAKAIAYNTYRLYTLSGYATQSGNTILDSFDNFIGAKPLYFSSDGTKILLEGGVITLSTLHKEPMIVKNSYSVFPLGFTKYIYYVKSVEDSQDYSTLFSSYFDQTVEFKYKVSGQKKYLYPTNISELTNQYLSEKNLLYISDYRQNEDGDFMWYLPDINTQPFNYEITALTPISKTEMGVFLEKEIWYCYLTDQGYAYNKTKLQVGIKPEGDVIIAYDASRILFSCERGFSALAYQDFVATTEQTLTFLSDNIYSMYKNFNNGPIKIIMYDFWILLYKSNSKEAWLFDTRNASWWRLTSFANITNVINHNDKLHILCNNKEFMLSTSDEKYFDYDGTKHKIDWFLTSQKLHFKGINYFKHLINLTLTSVLDSERELSFKLDILNYRKQINSGKPEILSYNVEAIRIYVQRLNYSKVNEFQYTLSIDEENAIQLPLSLSNITLKYKITGEVR